MDRCSTIRAAILAAGTAAAGILIAGSAAAQDSKPAADLGGEAEKLAAAKSALGVEEAERTIRGTLAASDERLDDGSAYDLYNLPLEAGQTVTLTMRSRTMDPYLMLHDATGDGLQRVGEDNNGGGGTAARITHTAERTGRFIVVANGATATDLGSYEISVVIENTPAREAPRLGTALAINSTDVFEGQLRADRSARLTSGAYMQPVVFQGRRGETVEVRVESAAFDTVLGVAAVFDDEMDVLASNDDISRGTTDSGVRLRLPYDGPYAAMVTSFSPGETGAFRVRIDRAAASETAMPSQNWEARYPGGGNPDETYVLLVGIDDYPGENNDLSSCITDVNHMARLSGGLLGVPAANIVVLRDEEATREHVVEAIRRHLGQAGPKGAAFFYFSGHGGQEPGNVARRDNEPDGRDEALIVWGEGRFGSRLIDDELGALIGELPAGRRLAVLDACHSGTGTLGSRFKWIDLKSEDAQAYFEAPKDFYVAAEAERPTDHLVISASAADQVAMAGAGGRPSVFTHYLLRAIHRNGTGITFNQLAEIVQRDFEQHRILYPNVIQVPQIEGVHGEMTIRDFFASGGGR